VFGGLAQLLREARALEQCLGGDAPPEHTGAAQRFTLNDGDLQPQLGAANGTHVAGGTTAEDDDVERSHGEFGWNFSGGAGVGAASNLAGRAGAGRLAGSGSGSPSGSWSGFTSPSRSSPRWWEAMENGEGMP